jgi:hypothetical protein
MDASQFRGGRLGALCFSAPQSHGLKPAALPPKVLAQLQRVFKACREQFSESQPWYGALGR